MSVGKDRTAKPLELQPYKGVLGTPETPPRPDCKSVYSGSIPLPASMGRGPARQAIRPGGL